MDTKKNYIWMLSSKSISMFATLLTASLINRALGPADRGVLAEIQTWIALFIVIFGLSMDTVTYHFANKDKYNHKDCDKFVTILVLNTIYSLVAALIFLILVYIWPNRFSSSTVNLITLIDVLLVITMFASNITVFFQARGRIKLSSIIGVLQAVANIGLISTAYFFNFISLKLIIIILIIIQSTALIFFLVMAIKTKLLYGRFVTKLANEMVKAGLKQHIATIFTFIYTKVNQLILIQYGGQIEAGLYAVPLNLVFGLMVIPATLQVVLYPRVIHSDDDYEVTIRALRMTFFAWGGIILVAGILAKPLILLYGGQEFISSIIVFRILLVTAWMLPLSSMISPYYIKLGAFTIASLTAVIIGVISIGLNILLVPRYLGIGAACATSLTTLLGFFIAIIFLMYLSKKNPVKVFNLKEEYELIRSRFRL